MTRKKLQPPFKKEELVSVAGTVAMVTIHGTTEYAPVVCLRHKELPVYDVMLFDGMETRAEALQRAYYISANYVLRNNTDPLPKHLSGGVATLAVLREKGYRL